MHAFDKRLYEWPPLRLGHFCWVENDGFKKGTLCMKKVIVGICGGLILLSILISLRSGALKAGELTEESSTIDVSVTEASQESVVPSVEESVQAPLIEEGETGVSEAPFLEPDAPEASTETSTSETTPPETSTTMDESAEASSTTESSSISSSSTSSSSSTKPSASSTGSSSKDTTSTSSTQSSSSTIPSTTTSSTGQIQESTSSSAATVPSTSQSQEQTPPPANPAPAAPAQGATGVAERAPETAAPSVQPQSVFAPRAPEAFSETSTLNLPNELKTSDVAQSDLKGFELPLLQSLEHKAHGALIYEGIKQLGVDQAATFDTEQLAQELYQSLFAIDTVGTPEKLSEELTIGSLIYQEKKGQPVLLGIYIGDNYYLATADVKRDKEEKLETTTEETTTKRQSKTTSTATEEAATEGQEATQRQVVVAPLDLEEALLVQALPEVTLTAYGQEVLAAYPAAMAITETAGAKAFIETIGDDAQKLGQDYDVFASVMIAQALLESGSGTSTLSLPPNHNLFGVKGTYKGQSVSMATQEDRGNGELYSIDSAFRKYPNYTASLGDYVTLLRSGISGNAGYYQKTWRSNAKNYLRTTSALTGTYATDTSYGQKLNSIIALYHLTRYDQVKVEKGSGVFIKGKEEIPAEYRNLMRYPDYNGIDYNASGSYPVGQCTWYAFNRVNQLGKSVDDYMGNGGEWAAKGKALGYEVSQTPKAGWLISFSPGTAGSDPRYGHVAFVEAVRPEGILISEGNVYGGTIISYRVIDHALATSANVSYIKAK